MSDEIETTEEAETPHLLDETTEEHVPQSRREADPFSDPAESGERPVKPYDSTLGNVANDVINVVDNIKHEIENVVDKIESDL